METMKDVYLSRLTEHSFIVDTLTKNIEQKGKIIKFIIETQKIINIKLKR